MIDFFKTNTQPTNIPVSMQSPVENIRVGLERAGINITPGPPGDDEWRAFTEERRSIPRSPANPFLQPADPGSNRAQQPQQQTPASAPFIAAIQPALGTRADFPPFWEDQPLNWFNVFEAVCHHHGITQSQPMFYKLVACLPASLSRRLDGVYAEAFHQGDPYKYTRDEIISRYQPDLLTRIRRLMHGPELGGRQPHELMKEIEADIPDRDPAKALDLLVKFCFIERLPPDLQGPLNSRIDTMSRAELAAEAQRRWRTRGSSRTQKGRPATMAALGDIESESDDSDSEDDHPIAAVPPKKQRQKGSKPKEVSRPKEDPTPFLCWKHKTFGEEAYACDDPKHCKMAKKIKKSGNARAGGR